MARRVYRPQLGGDGDQRWRWWLEAEKTASTMVVIEEDQAPKFTGLLDAAGNRLMVSLEQDPIGFVHFKVPHG